MEKTFVYVLNKRGIPLMPLKARKAKMLLKQGKACVVTMTPFIIRLTIATGETKQPVTMGVDSGYQNIGLSAVTEKEEVFKAEIKLRDDIVKLNSERRQYRRTRRNRKTWYRKPRFLNRKKAACWLAPSIKHKLDSHIRIINKIKSMLPITQINIEVANFDIQKIKNPSIQGTEYQDGEQKNFWNTREYVLYRDNHICQHCKGKSEYQILEVHHMVSRAVGGNRPDNLITLCSACHKKVSLGKLKLKVTPSKGLKAETFMSMVRWKLLCELKDMGNIVNHTYGYITKSKRIELNLTKSHSIDAFIISGGNGQVKLNNYYFFYQVRKQNRKLFKGARSHIKNTAPRFINGFQRFDKVRWQNRECFIFGRRSSGYFDLRMLDGTKVHSSAKSTN